MIIIADSGSTKAEWVVVKEGSAGDPVFTGGINPYFLSQEEIAELLDRELNKLSGIQANKIWFYGTGCNTPDKNEIVRSSLGSFFTTDDIFVGSDLLGAARSLCHDEPGIACILGTGSNSCYYDGENIVRNVPALGFILGDEGSAAVLGRKLLSDILKRQLPQHIIEIFFKEYNITQAEILESVYRRPFPSRFMGSFSRFLSENIEIPELEQIVVSSFDEFIVRNILQYSEATKCQIHFTGSIAYHFRDILTHCLGKYGLKPGKITVSPMGELIKYHIKQL
jgi:N-acetylglucosamine kinase-like BadF-type ATPase